MKNIFFTAILFFISVLPVISQNEAGEEMRAVWIATVKNIDFPSDKFSSPEVQKEEFKTMLDYFQEIGINAVMFQIRPAADAFYESDIEPWSEWLTGKQGLAPDPYYDPLKFYIDEAHKRNIEFHAWVNPFRAVATIEFADVAEDHISNTKPEWFFVYDIHKYFDPGIPEVRDYVTNIIGDIVTRYDVDGIHFDDYFYPYPTRNERGSIMEIPDFNTFLDYNTDSLSIEDWRRDNMNKFIRSVHDTIKSIKPEVVFGVAPSGVWRNSYQDPEGSNTRGLAHYDELYSDVLKWLKEDWIDYVAPQLYWPVGNKYADYQVLVKWWSEHTYGKHLYIGQAVYQAGEDAADPSWRDPNELIDQLKINRENPTVYGSIFYKAKSMTDNPFGFCDSLKYNYYSKQVSTPGFDFEYDTLIVADNSSSDDSEQELNTTNLDNIILNTVTTELGKKLMISWDKDTTGQIIEYKIYHIDGVELDDLREEDLTERTKDHYIFISRRRFPLFRKKQNYVIAFVDKNGHEYKSKKIVSVKI
jgi:uncharacterized lipoprotein YddW (UPF0748 family)